MPVLVKSATVLDLYSYFGGSAPEFRQRDRGRLHEVRLDPDIWWEMGRPAQITVTFEAGDHLADGVAA